MFLPASLAERPSSPHNRCRTLGCRHSDEALSPSSTRFASARIEGLRRRTGADAKLHVDRRQVWLLLRRPLAFNDSDIGLTSTQGSNSLAVDTTPSRHTTMNCEAGVGFCPHAISRNQLAFVMLGGVTETDRLNNPNCIQLFPMSSDRIIVFDLDGTLVDSMRDLVPALNRTICARLICRRSLSKM